MLLHLDGFDHLLAADLAMKYSVTGSPTITTSGARTNRCLTCVTNQAVTRNTTQSALIMFVGVAVKVDSLVASNDLIVILDGSTIQGFLTLNANGTLSVYRGGGTLLGTSTVALSAGTYYYIEFGYNVHSSLGAYNVLLNGVDILDAQNVNTRGAAASTNYANTFRLQGVTAATNKFDDLYVTNNVGPSPHNAYLGVGRVETLYPDGNGDQADWTSAAGGTAVFGDVSEAQCDSDTSYSYTSLAGNRQNYTADNVSGPTQQVVGVMVTAIVAFGDAGPHSIKLSTKPSTTNYDGEAQSITAAYLAYEQAFAINPQTGALWTPAELNAAKFGIKLES